MPKTQFPDVTDKGHASTPELDEHTLGRTLSHRPEANDGGALSKAGYSAQDRKHRDTSPAGKTNDAERTLKQ